MAFIHRFGTNALVDDGTLVNELGYLGDVL